MKVFKEIITGVKKFLAAPYGVAGFLVMSILIFVLFIMIPVWTTPGNDFLFQLSILEFLLVAVDLFPVFFSLMPLNVQPL